MESHYRWQIRTFWFGFLWMVISTITASIAMGIILYFVVAIWYLYRIIRGLLNLNDNKGMYGQQGAGKTEPEASQA